MNKVIDFYVDVIDNFWDLWFAVNLAKIMLKADLNLSIRLFSNDEKLFENMLESKDLNIDYFDLKDLKDFVPNKIIFNFFDRKIDFDYLHNFDFEIKLINFSYFLMHDWVSSLHNTAYQNRNVFVTHFVPSLLENTWWVLQNNNFNYKSKDDFLAFINEKYKLNIQDNKNNFVSVFVYKDTLNEIIKHIKNDENTYFIFWYYWLDIKKDNVFVMPFFEIDDYNNFLYICDINIVRGENSLVSSLLTWNVTLWDIYKENNDAHIYKIDDFIYFLNDFSFPQNYLDIFKNFNLGNKYKNFENITLKREYYKPNFIYLKDYIIKNCDAYDKIKKILN